jgi:hypothetical protein
LSFAFCRYLKFARSNLVEEIKEEEINTQQYNAAFSMNQSLTTKSNPIAAIIRNQSPTKQRMKPKIGKLTSNDIKKSIMQITHKSPPRRK